MRFKAWGLRFRAEGLRLRVAGLELCFKAYGLGFTVQGLSLGRILGLRLELEEGLENRACGVEPCRVDWLFFGRGVSYHTQKVHECSYMVSTWDSKWVYGNPFGP